MPKKPPAHDPSPRPRRKRESATARGYGHAWRKLRAAFLEAHPHCERCGDPAAEVHHRLPRLLGGSDEPENLEALCKPCHSRITATNSRRRRPDDRGASRAVLVCGPPGAGKSTYVRERMAGGDLVVDVDSLLAALTGRTLDDQRSPESADRANVIAPVLAARDAVVHSAATFGRVRVLWILSCAATPEAARRALAPFSPEDSRVRVVLLATHSRRVPAPHLQRSEPPPSRPRVRPARRAVVPPRRRRPPRPARRGLDIKIYYVIHHGRSCRAPAPI